MIKPESNYSLLLLFLKVR